jgi:hypothetical protein
VYESRLSVLHGEPVRARGTAGTDVVRDRRKWSISCRQTIRRG